MHYAKIATLFTTKRFRNAMIKYIEILVASIIFVAIYTPIDEKLKRHLNNKKTWLRYVASITFGGIYFFAAYTLLHHLLLLFGINDTL